MKDNFTEVDGEIREILPNTMFRVQLVDGRSVLAILKGKLRKAFVRVFPGDRVRVEMTPYDDGRGRISHKY